MGGFRTIPAKELTHRRSIKALENGAILLAANRAAFCDPILSEYSQSLKAGGKHHLTAVGAVARKMCNMIFTILKENRPYEVMPPPKRKEGG